MHCLTFTDKIELLSLSYAIVYQIGNLKVQTFLEKDHNIISVSHYCITISDTRKIKQDFQVKPK